ncbi:MAG: hypothetical protein FWE04_00965 [Oscillospiraceae bacterium]|nr:hypothetical protein [Oscillospiraceae bacterium]
MKKFKFLAVGVVSILLLAQVGVYATVQTQPIPPWERLNFNYQFRSGMDYRVDLGRPTTFYGIVPRDVFTANVRVDAQVALRPPSYGIFSGVIPTEPFNPLMPQPLNPHFGGSFGTLDNFGDDGFLPPTSIR